MPPVLHGLTSEFAHGRAFSEVVAVPNPVAGGGFTYTVSGAYWERLVSITFQLVADGSGSSRTPLVQFKDGGGVVFNATGSTSLTSPGATRIYVLTPAVVASAGPFNTTVLAPLPLMFLQPGFSVVVSAPTAGPSDQFSNIRIYREAFDTGPQGYPVGMLVEDDETDAYERLGD